MFRSLSRRGKKEEDKDNDTSSSLSRTSTLRESVQKRASSFGKLVDNGADRLGTLGASSSHKIDEVRHGGQYRILANAVTEIAKLCDSHRFSEFVDHSNRSKVDQTLRLLTASLPKLQVAYNEPHYANQRDAISKFRRTWHNEPEPQRLLTLDEYNEQMERARQEQQEQYLAWQQYYQQQTFTQCFNPQTGEMSWIPYAAPPQYQQSTQAYPSSYSQSDPTAQWNQENIPTRDETHPEPSVGSSIAVTFHDTHEYPPTTEPTVSSTQHIDHNLAAQTKDLTIAEQPDVSSAQSKTSTTEPEEPPFMTAELLSVLYDQATAVTGLFDSIYNTLGHPDSLRSEKLDFPLDLSEVEEQMICEVKKLKTGPLDEDQASRLVRAGHLLANAGSLAATTNFSSQPPSYFTSFVEDAYVGSKGVTDILDQRTRDMETEAAIKAAVEKAINSDA